MRRLKRDHPSLTVLILYTALAANPARAKLRFDEVNASLITTCLGSHITQHDQVALATCGSKWDASSRFWLKRLPWAVTTWKLREPRMLDYLRRNMEGSVRTNVLVHSLGQHGQTCLDLHVRYLLFLYTVDWILLSTDGESAKALRRHVSHTPSRNFTCEATGSKCGLNPETTVSSSYTAPVVFSRGCPEPGSRSTMRKQSQLRNTVVRTACIDIPHFRPANNKPNCNSWETDIIFNAMSIYNVTVLLKFYSDSAALARDMCASIIDIHRNLASANPAGVKQFDIPGLITYWYESFYVKRNSLVVRPFHGVLEESKFGLTLIAVALVLTLALLVLADMRGTKRWSAKEAADSLLFLLASLYNTSYSIPRVGLSTWLGGLLCGLWLLSMVPFCNYFLSELTSQETLAVFPEHMDTLAELERALDEKRVAPCVVKDTFQHQNLINDHLTENIYTKLGSAFRTHKDRERLVQLSYVQCLKCALRKDHICYAVSLPSWFKSPYKRMLVESRERINPALLTFAVRKNYPYKIALRDVIRRIIEAGLMRPPEDKQRQALLQKYDERILLEFSPLKLEELVPVFLLLMVLLAMCAVVCVLEIVTKRTQDAATADRLPIFRQRM